MNANNISKFIFLLITILSVVEISKWSVEARIKRIHPRYIRSNCTSQIHRDGANAGGNRDDWHLDTGELLPENCDDESDVIGAGQEIIEDCCACDEAKYEVTFEGLWSRHTHPKDFPANEWLTHFSDLIGASHSSDYRVWEYGGFASDGLRQVAEWGSTRTLESELKRQSNHIRTIIKARGLWYPNVNGKTFAVFRVDEKHHLMSLVSMLGPSPDWIVGVSSLELCLQNCSWIDERVINLYPYDAGTDSGVTYASANVPTIPRKKISRITSNLPSDPKNPFYDPRGTPMKPLARLTVKRQRVYEKSCGMPNDATEDFEEDEDAKKPECAVTDWGEMTPCSVTCGKGLTSRMREYINPRAAEVARCRRQLEEKEMCAAPIAICNNGNEFDVFGDENEPPFCRTTPWSEWTACSVTCGKGFMTRQRKFIDYRGRKKCTKETLDRKMCLSPVQECQLNPAELNLKPQCAITQWTDWSPCSKTCGKGTRVRQRSYLVHALAEQANCNINRIERQPCEGLIASCNLSPSEAREVCMQAKEPGPCRGYFPRYFYSTEKNMCLQFIYGGCRGNRNNFENYGECARVCEMREPVVVTDAIGDTFDRGNIRSQYKEKTKCVMSQWSDWSACSATCGKGFQEKTRIIEVHPSDDAKPCPTKLVKKKKCKTPGCKKHFRRDSSPYSFLYP